MCLRASLLGSFDCENCSDPILILPIFEVFTPFSFRLPLNRFSKKKATLKSLHFYLLIAYGQLECSPTPKILEAYKRNPHLHYKSPTVIYSFLQPPSK